MNLHFKQLGSGPPIIILHGLLGMLDNWKTFAHALAQSHMVYLVDQRNHGKSPHNNTMDYQTMAEDIKTMMEANWLFDGAIILGHSMGGKVGMQLALSEPDLVKKLIVIDIAPSVYKDGHSHIIQALESVSIDHVSSRSQVEQQLLRADMDPSIIPFLMKNLKRNGDRYSWKMNLSTISESYHNMLSAPMEIDQPYDGPSLFIKGGASDYINATNKASIPALFSTSIITEIPGAGHWVHADAFEALLIEVQQFIAPDQEDECTNH